MADKIYIELVDEKGDTVGLKEKFETHKNPVPLHRAISVVIYSPDKSKMLIQKRADNKVTWPKFWANATCTHPFEGESYKDAAERRLKEEMGFTVPLKEIFRFVYEAKYDETWGEHEYDVVFEGIYDGEVLPNPEEVSDYKWVEIKKLKKDVKNNPGIYTPWFKLIMEKL